MPFADLFLLLEIGSSVSLCSWLVAWCASWHGAARGLWRWFGQSERSWIILLHLFLCFLWDRLCCPQAVSASSAANFSGKYSAGRRSFSILSWPIRIIWHHSSLARWLVSGPSWSLPLRCFKSLFIFREKAWLLVARPTPLALFLNTLTAFHPLAHPRSKTMILALIFFWIRWSLLHFFVYGLVLLWQTL